MILTIKIPDELMEIYNAKDPANPKGAIQKTLEHFKDWDPAKRQIILGDDERKALEKVYGKPVDATEMPRFIEWVGRAASLNLGQGVVALSEAQRKTISDRAVKWNKTPAEVLKGQVEEFLRGEYGY